MHILRHGNDDNEIAPPVAKTQVECQHCGSLLAVTQQDIHEDDCGAFHHSNHDSFVTCAVCKRIVSFRMRNLKWSH